jgi:anti-sigma regulatory factor (Ser/Thr protein kinase)
MTQATPSRGERRTAHHRRAGQGRTGVDRAALCLAAEAAERATARLASSGTTGSPPGLVVLITGLVRRAIAVVGWREVSLPLLGETICSGSKTLVGVSELTSSVSVALECPESRACLSVSMTSGSEVPDREESLQVELPRNPVAPSTARRLIGELSAGELDGEELDRAKVMVSELVTNAVLHGQGVITLTASLDQDRLRVEVVDEGSGFERTVRERTSEELQGWGLEIVESEASRWGLYEGTTHVWFEIERPGPRLGADDPQTPETVD